VQFIINELHFLFSHLADVFFLIQNYLQLRNIASNLS